LQNYGHQRCCLPQFGRDPGNPFISGAINRSAAGNAYAIYSLMMINPQTSHAPYDEETFLMASTTERPYPRTPCVAVPPEYQSSFQEILADYGIRENTPATLIRALNNP